MKKLGVIPEQAVGEGSETMAEFFERAIASETSEPSIEAILAEAEESVKSFDVDEGIPEEYLPA